MLIVKKNTHPTIDKTDKGTETGTSFKHALYAKEGAKFNLHDTMIYQKKSCVYPDKNKYNNIFEYMFVFSKGKPKTCNYIKEKSKTAGRNFGSAPMKRPDSSNRDDRTEKLKNTKVKEYKIKSNVWKYPIGSGISKDKISFKHPAIFPEKLAEDHILSWSNEGDIILDPMCGAGTTCKMAWLNKRNFIGIDISEEYINDICKPRLKQYGWSDNNLNNKILI